MRYIKKLTLALLVVLTALPAFADSVTPKRAAEVAVAFFAGGAKRGAGDAGLKAAEVSSDAYMAFNRDGGGFVVIALNDAVTPVLAYSPEGSFPAEKDMPAPMAWWFANLAEQINALGDGATASEAVRASWENPEPVRGESKLYETALWSQDAPYNNNCPVVGGIHCLTGCVATAGAIIARFFQWPDAGVGTIPAKPSNVSGPDYPAHSLGHSYDWDNMPLSYSSYSSAQAEAVATLMYDMGTMAKMAYDPDFSSASAADLLTGLKEYMKYNKGAYQVSRTEYSDAQWSQLLKSILDDYGPTVYSGLDPLYGGHSFVLDGYDEQGRFHFNWGWGFSNCYCAIDNLVPEGMVYNFSERHQVMVGLVPDYDGTSTGRDILRFTRMKDNNGNEYNGLSATVTDFVENEEFVCIAAAWGPMANAFNGTLYFSLYDKNGNFKQDISEGFERSLPLNGFNLIGGSCMITTTIAPGDRIKVRYVGQYNEGIIDIGAGCVLEIIVMEDTGGGDEPDPTAGYTAAETAASTALSYAKSTSILTLTFAHPANWAVKHSSGVTVASGVAAAGGPVALDLSGCASGTYIISIGSADDPFTFTITK
ncbi:MAG: C10 family peptidase [Bacteroidales bacterium]|nr:C10 family peptidase [Bacteroidales bacterium]